MPEGDVIMKREREKKKKKNEEHAKKGVSSLSLSAYY
jgi:hypothetical protein